MEGSRYPDIFCTYILYITCVTSSAAVCVCVLVNSLVWVFLFLSLMQPLVDDGPRTILINNISPGDIRNLREALKEMFSLRNYLPLLNKVGKKHVCLSGVKTFFLFLLLVMHVCACVFQVFIEFESVEDADRFEVWYSPVQQEFGHEVHRLKTPDSSCTIISKCWETGTDEIKHCHYS